MQELVAAFSFERVHKAGAKFDPVKAKWINEQYFKNRDNEEIALRFKEEVIHALNTNHNDRRIQLPYIITAVKLLKEKVQFENELWDKGNYLFMAPLTYDEVILNKKWNDDALVFFNNLLNAFNSQTDWKTSALETVFKETATLQGINPGNMMQLFRVMLSGHGSGVALFEMAELLGKEEVNGRLEKALTFIKSLVKS